MITELKEKHKTEVKELLCLIRDKENNFNRAFDSEQKEIHHQKYKRCLDKAAYWIAVSYKCIGMISPDYARIFICDFILGRRHEVGQLTFGF